MAALLKCRGLSKYHAVRNQRAIGRALLRVRYGLLDGAGDSGSDKFTIALAGKRVRAMVGCYGSVLYTLSRLIPLGRGEADYRS